MIVILLIMFLLFMVYMAIRNKIVYSEQVRLDDEVFKLIKNEKSNDWEWRYDELDKLTYNRMIWQLFTFHWNLPESCYRKGEK